MQDASATTSDLTQQTFLDRVLGPAQRAWTAYWQRRAASATVAILHSLDDRAMKDIGLDRSEIESVVYGDCGRKGDSTRASFRERRVGMC